MAQRQLETPHEDVPPHLADSLWTWTSRKIENPGVIQRLALDMRVSLENNPFTYRPYALDEIEQLCREDAHLFLDVVEWVLATSEGSFDVREYRTLNAMLAAANSAYSVRADMRGLEMRTTPEVQAEVQAVVDSASGSPGLHLAEAWNQAYSRRADPVKSYSESIKAAEAALASVVSPQNPKQTLGTMIRDVAAKPSKWKFAIADGNVSGVDTILQMMRMLWDGQTSRHGGIGHTRAETVEEAQAAVHLAATLVQFGVSGAFALA